MYLQLEIYILKVTLGLFSLVILVLKECNLYWPYIKYIYQGENSKIHLSRCFSILTALEKLLFASTLPHAGWVSGVTSPIVCAAPRDGSKYSGVFVMYPQPSEHSPLFSDQWGMATAGEGNPQEWRCFFNPVFAFRPPYHQNSLLGADVNL